MKKKKSEKANLEKNRLIYFEAGLILALSLSLVAFEWSKTPSKNQSAYGHRYSPEDFTQIERTIRKEIQEIKRPKIIQVINPVDDKNIIIDQPGILQS